MKRTAAHTSDDGLTLHEYDFVLSRMGDDDLVFRLVAVRRWQRENDDELTPWGEPVGVWHHVDISHKNTIREAPDVPDSVMTDARQIILQSIIFETP
jgi:hypothetical protein